MSAVLRTLVAMLVLVAASLPGMPAAASESILSYDTDIQIQSNGALVVTEHIIVHAEGNQIRRGIYRDFPTRYRDHLGNRVRATFQVLEVLRDGRPEPWFTEKLGNGIRLATGDDSLLRVPASHRYTLRYRTTRQLGYFDGFDELYFNAIPQDWAFPIEHGSIQVQLPGPVDAGALRIDSYSGPAGTRGDELPATSPQPGLVRWELTRPLPPRVGATVSLGFPKGMVAEPARMQRLAWLLDDNRGALLALAGWGLLLWFCVVRWHKVGRDPPPGTIIVRYGPPEGHTPGGLRYMRRMRYDDTCFSADLLSLAIAGALLIEQKGKKDWSLKRIAGGATPVNPQLAALLGSLFAQGDTLPLDPDQASRISSARTAHAEQLAKLFQPALFKRNVGSVLAASAIALAFIIAAFRLCGDAGVILTAALSALIVATVVVFAVLVAAPTPAGRQLLDWIEGFTRYLGVAEQQDLQRLQAPGAGEPLLDAARFEQLLPYAVALDVEDAWTRKFTLAAGSAAAAAAAASVAWYHGSGSSDIGSLARAVGSSLGARITSSSTPPGRSSGGGGGGFSGGGGGGGGGGGR